MVNTIGKHNKWPWDLTNYLLTDNLEVGCRTWQLNGSSIFVGPGLENYVYSSLELDLSDGFLNSDVNDRYSFSRYAAPLPGTKLVFDFELDCVGDCSLSLFMVSINIFYWINVTFNASVDEILWVFYSTKVTVTYSSFPFNRLLYQPTT